MSRFSRRDFLGLAGVTAAGAALAACDRDTSLNPLDWAPYPTQAPTPTMRPAEPLTPSDALERLAAGNRRFVEAQLVHPDQAPERRTAVASGQAPFAIILSCSDSRVAPEILFDQGLGDLFVVRVAGNVLSDAILASLEYGAAHLKAPLIMVLGHKRCGAVKAAVDTLASGSTAPGHIASLVKDLRPAIADALPQGADPVEAAVRQNILLVVAALARRSEVLGDRLRSLALQAAGGYYDLDTGQVEVIVKTSA